MGLWQPVQPLLYFAVRFLCLMLCSATFAFCDEVVEIPFTYHEDLIWIKLHQKGNNQTLNFLLDSGASVSVLDARVAQRLNAKGGTRVSVQGVEAVAQGRWPVTFQFAETQFPAKFLTLDLSALSSKCICNVDGLIGLDFFRDRVVEIDYEHEVLRLVDRATVPHGAMVRLKKGNQSFAVELLVDQKPGWFRVDTGCAHPLEWTSAFPSNGPLKSRTSIGLQISGVIEQQTEVEFAGQVYAKVPTGMHRERIFPGEDGLVGNPFLQHFKVTFDLPHSRLFLQQVQP